MPYFTTVQTEGHQLASSSPHPLVHLFTPAHITYCGAMAHKSYNYNIDMCLC